MSPPHIHLPPHAQWHAPWLLLLVLSLCARPLPNTIFHVCFLVLSQPLYPSLYELAETLDCHFLLFHFSSALAFSSYIFFCNKDTRFKNIVGQPVCVLPSPKYLQQQTKTRKADKTATPFAVTWGELLHLTALYKIKGATKTFLPRRPKIVRRSQEYDQDQRHNDALKIVCSVFIFKMGVENSATLRYTPSVTTASHTPPMPIMVFTCCIG